MKIQSIHSHNRRHVVELVAGGRSYTFPHAKLSPAPARGNPLVAIWLDPELGEEGFSWRLKDGREGSLHLDAVLEENREPDFMAELLLYKLSLEADRRLKASGLGNRELIRRLGTSASQYYRLLDPANTRKSINKLLALLYLLDCEVELVIKDRAR